MQDRIDFAAIASHHPLPTVAAGYVELKRSGREYEALCPFHADRNPSLTLFLGRDGNWRYQCFACGAHGDVFDWIANLEHVTTAEAARRLAGDELRPERVQLPEPEPDPWQPQLPVPVGAAPPDSDGRWIVWNPKRGRESTLKPSMVWPYLDRNGRLLGYVVRCDLPERRKWTPTVTWCVHRETGEARWCLARFPRPLPLYGLDALDQRPADHVLLVSGEKCAAAGARLLPGFVCVTWPGGDRVVGHVDVSPLSGRAVTLWPDADESCMAACKALAERLHGKARSLRMIDPSGQPEGWDIADALEEGWSTEQTAAWCRKRVRAWEPQPLEPQPLEPQPAKAPAEDAPRGAVAAAPVGGETEARSPAGTADDTAPAVNGAICQAPDGIIYPATLSSFVPAERRPVPRTDLDEPAAVVDALPARYSEDNVALAFVSAYADDLRHVAAWGRWLLWTGQRWQPDDTGLVLDLSRRVCRGVAQAVMEDETLPPRTRNAVANTYGMIRTVNGVERLARVDRRVAATASQWDRDAWVLNTPAGVVDLRTGKLRAPQREDHCTKITACAPADTEAPQWAAFLDTVTGGDAALIAYLQRLAGYALTGSTREHMLAFFYGSGRNGKGTFLNTLTRIMGDYAHVADMDLFTESRGDRHPTSMAALRGARLVTAQETEEGRRWAESRIKQLTGGDPITARYMRQDEFTFEPAFTLIIAGNHKPGLRNIDEAIKARLHLVPFTVTIPPEARDKDLPEKLMAEAPAILRWMIEGCLAWQETGLAAPDAVNAATAEYLEQQDTLGSWLEDCCELAGNYECKSSVLYASYRSWAERTGEFVMPQKRWIAAMETRGLSSTRKAAGVIYQGVRTIPDEDREWVRSYE